MEKVKIEKDKCIGCGACAATCPEVFELGPDGYAAVKKGTEEKITEEVKVATESCPTGAIEIEKNND